MIVYHVDKSGLLLPGQKVSDIKKLVDVNKYIRSINDFFDGNLQMFALQTLKETECGDCSWVLTEAVLEYVRALKFAKLPSRLAVLYASRTIEEAEWWRRETLPENPTACIVSLCTGRKVYSANFALRDEVYKRIAEFSDVVRDAGPRETCAVLAHTLSAAERYWRSIAAGLRMFSSRNMGREELLLVPPVRVIDRVYP
jgi:hypothetical protein